MRRYCRRGIYLADGELRADGPIEDVIEQYERDQETWVERDIEEEPENYFDRSYIDTSDDDTL